MKSIPFIILLFSIGIIACQKKEANNTKPLSGNAVALSGYNNARLIPTVTVTGHWRLYRKKYDCEHKFSICTFIEVTVSSSIAYDDVDDWTDGINSEGNDTTGYRNPKVKVQFDSDSLLLRGKFCQLVDTSEGSVMVFEAGDSPDIDSVVLAAWGVDSLVIVPGSYSINFDTTNSRYGEIVLPVVAY